MSFLTLFFAAISVVTLFFILTCPGFFACYPDIKSYLQLHPAFLFLPNCSSWIMFFYELLSRLSIWNLIKEPRSPHTNKIYQMVVPKVPYVKYFIYCKWLLISPPSLDFLDTITGISLKFGFSRHNYWYLPQVWIF